MEKTIGGITRQFLNDNCLWVGKYYFGGRTVGTLKELESEMNDFRDFDILCKEGQPESLHTFFDVMMTIEKAHGWMTFDDLFDFCGV